MASATENSVKVDLTTCSICFETFKTPKYFPCLHSFCEGCIKTYITTTFVQTNGGVNCPVCRMYVSKPEDIGIEEWSSELPTNHILVNLIVMNESKSGQKLCMPCSRENETESASSWCINCGEALCKLCERYHRKQKSSITHKLIDMGNYETTDLQCNVDIPCTEHPDKNVEAYCRDHSAICCMTCAFLKHRNCKNVGSIHDAAEEMKKSREVENFSDALQGFQNTLDALLQYTSDSLHEFDKDIEKMKVEIDTLFTKLSKHLSHLKSDIMSEISKIEKEVRPEIEDKHDKIKCKISTIQNDLALFQTNMKYAPPTQFLQAMEKLMEQRSILEQFVNEESQKLKEIRVTFDANEKLLQIEKDIKVFGEVNFGRASRTDMVRPSDRNVNMSSVVPTTTKDDMTSLVPTLSSEVNIQDGVTGISVLENGLVLLSKCNNKTIELRDHQCSSVLSSLSLPGPPWGIKMSSDTEGAVAVYRHGLIIFNIQNNQITKIKKNQDRRE
ncbi:hypothetical protein FSP39_014841 [Pinctada imbricata]|uniref:Uncharacterized protein n=1 Tax=Pinctada imbricata TaxID=66713 RepID=A0AA89BKX3_PINIB|nr:hypothetical protein FSP39_014841 [Pinctada imbricata]